MNRLVRIRRRDHAGRAGSRKNAIMMIDFALDAQRTEGKTPTRRSSRDVSSLSGNHDDHDGRADGHMPIAIGLGAARRRAAHSA